MTNTMTKDSLHQLVDELPEAELTTALRFLQYLKEVSDDIYVETSLVMQDDEEQVLEETEQSVADAWRTYLDSRSGYGQGML